MNKPRKIRDILRQVPPDYYDRGMTKNLLQKIWHGRKYQTFKSLVGDNEFKTILDLGCASGTMTNWIAQVFLKSRIIGIDAYPSAIKYAKKKYSHLKFLVADAHNLPFKKNSFDLVVCYETIEHVVKPTKVLQEIKRVLTSNGRAIVAMDSGRPLFRIVWWVWEKTKGKVWQGAHLHPFHHTDLERLIRKEGFKIEEKCFSHIGMEVSFILKK